ncbi:MAG TPA: ferritin family protein [Anaerohalosphaeraceae bacterium]|nr:ferritin family protein [Anaerohalosphaeraceae bacterium]HOL88877.1 ferritin family protein [Anaerohalosphaeraceae bacterium]HPP55719.1 ferritin family protein [Anaerohalosphaeraceae bacterium]
MLKFRTFDEVLDFAIVQEKAAQQFYAKLAQEVRDPAVKDFYRQLTEEEKEHERRLISLKGYAYALREPDLRDLSESGYLDAMPVPADVSLKEALQFAIRKERSAEHLYSLLADLVQQEELEQLFRVLSAQELRHRQVFEKRLAMLEENEKKGSSGAFEALKSPE